MEIEVQEEFSLAPLVKDEPPDFYEYFNDDSGCDLKMEPFSGLPMPLLSQSAEPFNATISSSGAGISTEMKQQMETRLPVIKLERVDQNSGNSGSEGLNYYPQDKGYLTVSEEEEMEEENEDGLSDDDEDEPRKARDTTKKNDSCSGNFWHHQSLRVFPGQYTCSFCPKTWNYAGELAVHESQEHSTPSSRPGNMQKSTKKRYFCARCPFNCLRRALYVNHHLSTHLSLPVPPITSNNNTPSTSKDLLDDTFPCEICQWPLSKSKQHSKRDHFRVQHNIKDLSPSVVERCPQCPAYFRRGIQLIRHKQVIHNGSFIDQSTNHRRQVCQNCNKSFYTLPDLWRHRRDHCEFRHTFLWIATCPLEGCFQKFESTADLDYHLTNSHSSDKLNGAVVSCPECGRQCMGHFGLLTHMSNHQVSGSTTTEDGQLQCQYCGEKLKSRMYFNRHMKRHFVQDNPEAPNPEMERGFVCDQCGKHFSAKSLLLTHQEFHKTPQNWRWECSECGKKCVTKQQLQVHSRTHTGEKPYVCEICGEAFAYRHFLRNHVNLKHMENGAQIPVRRYQRNDLAEGGGHLGKRRKFSGESPEFRCDQCQKHFSTKQALQVHGRVHSGEMPFECQICRKRFRYRQLLRTHINDKHKDEGIEDKPRAYRKRADVGQEGNSNRDQGKVSEGQSGDKKRFGCQKCGKLLSTKQAMQIHMRTHTGELPFECRVCHEKFRYRHVLRDHVNEEHAKDGVLDLPRSYTKRENSK